MSKTSAPRPRRQAKNTYTTKSGKIIKLNRSLSDRMKANRDAKARRKAAYLSTLPKEPWKRILYRLQPKRVIKYWFSRDGAIMALKITGIGFVVIFLLLVGLFAYFRKDLPQIKNLADDNLGGSITYYDRTGKTVLFQDYGAIKRVGVQSNQISNYVKDATVAVEDKGFYKEGAFSVKGIVRAGLNDATGGSTQGGSTITQQLVKLNEGWTNDHTISRKVKELILAVELEREYDKDDILTAYLNIAPYGGVDYGVQSASEDYFGVSANQLTIAQAAMLAAIPKAPTSLSPFSDPTYNPAVAQNYFDKAGLLARQQYIINLMASQGYITQAQATAAKKVDILAQIHQLQSHYQGITAPYFVLAAKEQLQTIFPASVVKRGGWKVITTVDLNLQALAEKSLADGENQMRRQNADDAGFVAEDNSTGQVVALIGGEDFATQQINYAVDAKISPGSSIKPYTYSTLINNNNNVGAGSVLFDTQGPLPGYPCTNHSLPENGGNCLFDDTRSYSGAETLRYALGGSLNVPAVKAFTSVVPNDTSPGHVNSINKVMSTVDGLMDDSDGYKCYISGTDITTDSKDDETQCGASAGIGDGAYMSLADHVNGIASISRLGQAIPQTFILKVTDSSGKVLNQFTQPKPKQVVKPDAAYIVNSMASDPGASYLGGHCTTNGCSSYKFHRYKGWDNAIKTGTTNNLLDGLMMSWNTKYTAGIWVGNYTHTEPYTGQPEYMTDPIMKEFMQGAIDQLGNVKPVNWTEPSGVKTAPAYVMHRVPFVGQTSPSPSTDLFPSWYVGGSSANSSQTLDKVSGLLATSCTPTLAQQVATNSNANTWNVDVYAGGSPSRGSTATTSTANQPTDNIHSCDASDLPSVFVTTISCDNPTKTCNFTVVATQGKYALAGGSYTTLPAGTLELLVNGKVVKTVSIDPSVGSPYNDSTDFSNIPIAVGDTVTAEVVDSVLYSATGTATIPSTYAPVTTPVTPPTPPSH